MIITENIEPWIILAWVLPIFTFLISLSLLVIFSDNDVIPGAVTCIVICLTMPFIPIVSCKHEKTNVIYTATPIIYDFKSKMVFVDTSNYETYTTHKPEVIAFCRSYKCMLSAEKQINLIGKSYQTNIMVRKDSL